MDIRGWYKRINIVFEKLIKWLGIRQFANQDERGPKIRVGILLAKLLHGGLQGERHITGGQVPAIEDLHQLRGALIMDVPQRQQERGCSGAK